MHPWGNIRRAILGGFPRLIPHPKRLLQWGLLCLGLTALGLGSWFLVRDAALQWGLQRLKSKLSHHQLELRYESAAFTQWQTVSLQSLTLQSLEHPKLAPIVKAHSLEISLRWWTFWNIGLAQLKTEELSVHYVEDSAGRCNFPRWNYDPAEQIQASEEDVLVRLVNQLNRALAKSPSDMKMVHTRVLIDRRGQHWGCFLPMAQIDGSHFRGQFQVTQNRESVAKFSLLGELNHRQLEGSTLVVSPFKKGENRAWLPFAFDSAGFQRASFSIESLDDNGQMLDLKLIGEINGLYAEDPRLSDTAIEINHLQSDLTLHVNSQQLEVDSSSWVELEDLGFHPFAFYRQSGPSYALGLHIPKTEAQLVFNSLPIGLFRNIGHLKAKGQLEYRFWANLNGSKPDSCRIISRMYPSSDFAIVDWGDIHLHKLNRSFTYSYYDRGLLAKQFTVGPEWSGFTLLNEVSPKLLRCILQSEDPSFFQHRGFVPDAFRASLAANYKEKRFKRGASTISMQLVKNLFLGRRKTMARKVEEILITWLMEREHVVNKTRLMEIYLNIVEWGPGLFGAKNASQFYFGKDPLDLEWEEAAYLACLIPRPKSAFYTLDEHACVVPTFSHVPFLLNHMAQKDPTLGIDTGFHSICIRPESYALLAALKGRTTQSALDTTWVDDSAVPAEILSD